MYNEFHYLPFSPDLVALKLYEFHIDRMLGVLHVRVALGVARRSMPFLIHGCLSLFFCKKKKKSTLLTNEMKYDLLPTTPSLSSCTS